MHDWAFRPAVTQFIVCYVIIGSKTFIINYLIVNIMDKNNVIRTYSLKYGSPEVSTDKKEVLFLYQFSQFQDEFGIVTIIISREMEGEFPVLRACIQHNRTRSAEEYYSILNSELSFFTISILPLFNPLSFNKDALPFQEKE